MPSAESGRMQNAYLAQPTPTCLQERVGFVRARSPRSGGGSGPPSPNVHAASPLKNGPAATAVAAAGAAADFAATMHAVGPRHTEGRYTHEFLKAQPAAAAAVTAVTGPGVVTSVHAGSLGVSVTLGGQKLNCTAGGAGGSTLTGMYGTQYLNAGGTMAGFGGTGLGSTTNTAGPPSGNLALNTLRRSYQVGGHLRIG